MDLLRPPCLLPVLGDGWWVGYPRRGSSDPVSTATATTLVFVSGHAGDVSVLRSLVASSPV